MKRSFTLKLDSKPRKDKYEITSQGFLKCDAFVTRSGVFDYEYKKDDGTLTKVREYRSPEEVFNPDSMNSLKMVPVTWDHPKDMISKDNVKDYQIGTTGEIVEQEGDFLKTKVLITDKKAIDMISQRHKMGQDIELSCGYDCDVEDEEGEHPKEGKYNAVQKNIRYNHLSIVDEGRAGGDVKLKLDKKDQKEPEEIKIVKLDSYKSKNSKSKRKIKQII